MDGAQLTEELLERFNGSNSAPWLFVGSGLSRRYLGTGDWSGLLRHLAATTQQAYPYYLSKANSDLPTVASLIAETFHEIWWSSEQYALERDTYGEQFTAKSSPLKLQAAKYVEERSLLTRVPDELNAELTLLRSARLSGIITTNWDDLMEQLFPEFKVFVGQNEALFSQTYSIAEIFKVHGSFNRPESLVLTAEDYHDFNLRNAYLAAKLLTTFLDHPIVFLGYSLGDQNIKSIFNSVVQCLDEERIMWLARRLLFIEYEPDRQEPNLTESMINLGSRDLRLTIVQASDFTPVYQALANTEYRLNAKLLRQIKEHLYELVKTNDPTEKIAVIDVENLDNWKDIEIVVGVGISSRLGERGFLALQAEELYQDIVMGGVEFNARASDLVEKTINNMLRGSRKFVPVFKYLGLAGALDVNRRPVASKICANVLTNALQQRSVFEASAYYRNKRHEVAGMTLDQVVARYAERSLPYLTLIDHDVDRLRQFIRDNFEIMKTGNGSAHNCFQKLICIYDRLQFGPGFPVEPSELD